MYHMSLLMEGRKLIQIALNYFMCKKKNYNRQWVRYFFYFFCASSFLLEPPLFEFANFSLIILETYHLHIFTAPLTSWCFKKIFYKNPVYFFIVHVMVNVTRINTINFEINFSYISSLTPIRNEMIPQFIANRFQYTIMQLPFVEEDRFFREQKLEPM